MELQDFYNLIPNIDSLKFNQTDEIITKIRELYNKLDDPNLSFAFFKLSQHIMRLKNINPQTHDFLEDCIKDIIKISVFRRFAVGSEALRVIFNAQAQYYRHSKLDSQLKFPLGFRHPLKYYQPQVGQQCDIVKPYISSVSYCCWTRGIIISKDGKKYLVKYANSQIPTETKQQPFCAPLGTRTKDFDWRMNLNIGDQVDAYHKVWYSGTVVGQQTENGVKRVRVTFKIFSETGEFITKNGQKYDGLEDIQDQLYQVTSYRIQKYGKMSKKFCLYSLSAEQFIVDDTYDLLFQKQYQQQKFRAIMRIHHTRSQSFLQFYETFCDLGGNTVFLNLLDNYNKQNLDFVFNIMIIVANSSFLIPRMRVNEFLPEMLNKVLKLLYDNSKLLSPQRNQMLYFFIDVIAKRFMSLSEKHLIVNQIRKRLTLDFLKLNMEKQMLALRLLYELINPVPRKYTQSEKKQVDQYLKINDIFYQIIQPNTHEQILIRSIEFIKYLLKNQLISFKEIQYLWNIYPPTDLRGKSTVEKMIGDIAKTFSIQYTQKVITKILSYKQFQLTVDNLALLRSLKDHAQLQDQERLNILQYLWQIITLKSGNITETIEEQIQKVFKSVIPTLKSNKTKLNLLKLVLNRLGDLKQLNNQFVILKEFILTYPKKSNEKSSDVLKIQEQSDLKTQENQKIPSIIAEVIQFLKSKQIYQKIINIFNQLKNSQKMKNVLWFTAFLFQNDKDNVNEITKIFYDKMGPTDIFFEWAQHITQKAHQFFIQFFSNYQNLSKFQSLSSTGFDALKVIIFDVNIKQGNLKLIKKSKGIAVQSTQASDKNKNQSNQNYSVKGPIYGPTQKPQTLTFLYLLRSPYQCKGVKFLEELLCVVSNSKVYDQIIKLIIQFFVNLDDSIQDRTKQFREQFLMDIIQKFRQINQKNQYNNQIKLKLQISINLLQQLFSETQKDGLLDIKPHFECIQGETLKLKIENQLTGNKIEDIKLQINQNSTFCSLKARLAQIYNQKPEQLNVYKFVNPLPDEINAKSLVDLHFFNDEVIKIMRKSAKDIPRKQLLNETGQQLSPKVNSIVQKWFNSYKNQKGEMGFEQLKQLSSECWKGSALKQISKLNQMLKKFDINEKGYLNLQEFKNFFVLKCNQNAPAIWRILNLAGYKNNLKYKDQPEDQLTSDIFPRKILSNQKVFQVIFSILQNKTFEAVHLIFYRLLSLLETDQNLKQQVKKNAKSLIQDQTSLYKLSYILETVLSQILKDDEFYFQFYKNKGCEFIFHKLLSFMSQNKSIYTFDTLIKTIIMPNMIKILNSYIFSLHSQNRMIRYIKKFKINQSQVDLLVTQLKKIDQIIPKENQLQGKLVKLKQFQTSVSDVQYYQLAQKIVLNLIQNFSNDLLKKTTNQIVRMYSSLSLSLNLINREQIIKALKCQSLNYRRFSQNLVYLYLVSNPSEVKDLLELLLSNIPEESKSFYNYFFTLLQKVLQMYLDSKKQQAEDAQFIQLADKLFKKLFNEIPNQNRNAILSDKLILGVLMVIKILLVKREGVRKTFTHMKKQLLEKCLFFYHPRDRILPIQITPQMLKNEKQANHFNDYVKCKYQDTRKVLMEIIYLLHEVSAQEDPKFVDQYILPIFNDLPKQKRKFQTKSMQVGLNNLGSTCYLNSMLQVVNSISPFRNGVMQCQNQIPLLKQLKNLFSYLYFSERQDYIPEELLKSFVPPILKGIQQDTTQFLNILLDQLQNSLKKTPEANLLEEIFQGSQAVQMVCHACGQKRQRQQPFFTYEVLIQGKYDLNSAFEGMHTGQLITDCLCQYCGQRADTTKRTVIDRLPNFFFVHLKRIVFNYDVFMNTKIHTRLQFPNQLNFEPYTKEGLQLRESLGVEYLKNLKDNQQQKKKFEQLTLHDKVKDYYKLKLKAIIVHSGGPQVGHYWAIVKKQSNWVKFDDSRVTVFPISSMESQCYGGNFQSDEWGGMGSSTNAYVLLYEKQLKTDIILGQDQNKKIIPCDKFQTLNTSQLYKDVWLDNHSLMLENHLLRDTYCRQFIHFLVQMLKITPSNSKIQVISETLYKVCFHSGQTGKLMDSLQQNLNQIQPDIFKNYIYAQKQRTFDLLFHNNANVRDFTATYIQKVLIQTFKKGTEEDKSQVLKFIDQYLFLLHSDVAKNWLRIDGYFRLFQGLVVNSLDIKGLHQFLIQKHLISYFIDFIMEKSSPLSIYPKKYSIGTKSNPAHFGYAIPLILFLIKRSYGLTGVNYQVPTIDSDQLHHLSDNDALCLSSIGFYEKMLRQRQNLEYLGLIIQRLSIKNILFSEAIARVLLSTLNEITDAKDEMVDICSCISKYLIITDQYWSSRAQFVLGYSSPYIFNDNLMTSLDQQRFVFYSTLQDLFPIECLLAYCHINRLRNPLTVLHILRTILQGCSVNETSKQYLTSQRSPSYHHQRYLDWVKPYLNGVVETLNLSKQKRQAVLKQVQCCNSYVSLIEEYKYPMETIITGKILNTNVVDRFSNQENTVQVVVSNVEAYTLKSIPTGFGNQSLDAYLDHGRFCKKVTKQSNILYFFKEFSKPLAIKQSVQQDQDKAIQSLFDDCIDKKPQDNKITQEKKAQVQQAQQPANKDQEKQNIVAEQKIEVQQKKQPKEEEIIHEINIPGIQLTSDYFRKIQIINNSNKTKRVMLLFKTNENSNMLAPSKIYFISTKKAVETMWICKIDSKKGWGPVDYELVVDQKQPKAVPKWFKLYGEVQQSKKPEPMQIQMPNSQNSQQNLPSQSGQMYNEGNNAVPGMMSQIYCPICTYLNLATEENCQVCGSSLRG